MKPMGQQPQLLINHTMRPLTLIIAIFIWLTLPDLTGHLHAQNAPSNYQRADAEDIKQKVEYILSQKDFQPHKTLSQKFESWFKGLNMQSWDPSQDWVQSIIWFIVIWCGLSLLAIFIHFIWTLFYMFYEGPKSPKNVSTILLDEHLSFEESELRMKEYLSNNSIREATGMMMLALLKYLDHIGRIRFHISKTNGDYLMEYSTPITKPSDFKSLVHSFDQYVYGSETISKSHFDQMYSLFEKVKLREQKQP